MHGIWITVVGFFVFETLRHALLATQLTWVRPILDHEMFKHIGDLDDAFLIVYLPIYCFMVLGVRRKRLIAVTLICALAVSLYAVFDAELNSLPLLTLGEADVLDIPAGIFGWLCAWVYVWHWYHYSEFLNSPNKN